MFLLFLSNCFNCVHVLVGWQLDVQQSLHCLVWPRYSDMTRLKSVDVFVLACRNYSYRALIRRHILTVEKIPVYKRKWSSFTCFVVSDHLHMECDNSIAWSTYVYSAIIKQQFPYFANASLLSLIFIPFSSIVDLILPPLLTHYINRQPFDTYGCFDKWRRVCLRENKLVCHTSKGFQLPLTPINLIIEFI